MGTSEDVYEFAVTDGKFELIRKLNLKKPVVVSGQVFPITHEVSLLRYSHSGHLLAVVTGRVAQVFDLSKTQYTLSEPSGTPSIALTSTDHRSHISNLAFTHDDTKVYTSSLDGYIFCYSLITSQRTADHCVRKKLNSMLLCLNTGNTLCAAYTLSINGNLSNGASGNGNSLSSTTRSNMFGSTATGLTATTSSGLGFVDRPRSNMSMNSSRSRPQSSRAMTNTARKNRLYQTTASRNSMTSLFTTDRPQTTTHTDLDNSYLQEENTTPDVYVTNTFLHELSHCVSIFNNGDFDDEISFNTEYQVTAMSYCKMSHHQQSSKDSSNLLLLGMYCS